MRNPRRLMTGFLSLVLLFATFAATARPLPETKPERVGLSSERLERLSAHMAQEVDDGTMVGGLAMIARNGKIAYVQSWGERDREAELPMTRDTLFRIYSMTKPITAVAL